MQKRFQNKTVSTNFFSLKGGEFDLFEFTMLFHKHLCSLASSRQIPKTSKTLSKTFGNFQKRKCSPVEKTFCWDCWKTSCTWSWKTTSNFTSKRSHQKLIPNSFAVQIASSANEFHRKRSSSPKSWCQTSSSKITKSPCFCIQIQMSSHRSASFPEFCPTVLSKTSKHSHHASYMQET